MLNPEVQKIFATVEEFASSQKFGPVFAESRVERVLFVVIGISFIATLVLLFYKPWQFWALVAGLVFLLGMVSLVVAQALSTLAEIRAPLKGYASAAEARLRRRVEYVEKLAGYSTDGLQLASQALETDASRMQKRLYSLVGVIDKAGFIPAGIALYFSATKIMSGNADFSTNLITAFFFGLYGGAFLGHRIVELLSLNVTCLQEALVISERRRNLGGG